MRITKLHLILLMMVILFAGYFSYQYRQEQVRQAAVLEEQHRRAAEQARLRIEREKKKAAAVQAVAVAGEYWIAGTKEKRDVSAGQATLHRAKEILALERFDEAQATARESIEQFKQAKFIDLKYTVKRGDNLWKIARMKKHYGRGSMWPVIWRANEKKIPDFEILRTRLVLSIPKAESEIKKYTRFRKI